MSFGPQLTRYAVHGRSGEAADLGGALKVHLLKSVGDQIASLSLSVPQ